MPPAPARISIIVLRESVGSGGSNPPLHFPREARFPGFEAEHFLAGKLRQFGFGGLGGQELAVFLQVGQRFEISAAGGGQVFEPRVFARKFLEPLLVLKQPGVAQHLLDLVKPLGEAGYNRTQIHGLGKKQSARKRHNSCGRRREKALLLFPLGDDSGLRRLGFSQSLLELIDASGGIDELLLSGIKRMADVANTHQNC